MERNLDTFNSAYDAKSVEEHIYKRWEKSGFFNPDNLPVSKDAKPYTVALPPPNVTGVLHMGHALNATVQDIVIRKKRMEGYRALWIPGTDHAGIATQNVVEKQLKKEGLSRHDLGKEQFLEKVWEWKEKYGNIILDQLKRLGASLDWSRTTFTMDEGYQKAVKAAFAHYHKKGLIYQGERVINWCARCATSLSDLELEYQEEQGALYFIRYPLSENAKSEARHQNYIVVATTRPETMLGDTAVAVHPDDKRYQTLVGKNARLPIQERDIPVIADAAVEMEFGTGAVKVTPAHSITDFEIAERHKLPLAQIIDERGKMTKASGICEGLNVEDCRAKVVQTLKEKGLLEKEEPLTHNVAHCYRCNKTIEQLASRQWFVKMGELAKAAAEEVRAGRVRFHPKNFEKPYFDWLANTKDWCISRQIWWGHPVPVEGSEDVLDTWFSSALWPFATLGWPAACAEFRNSNFEIRNSCTPVEDTDLQKFYPTQALFTGRDIINLWVSRMIFSALEFTGRAPFADVYINPTVLAKNGQRMSKSLGTGVDPMELIEKYGADATRFGLIWQNMGVQDIRFAEEHLVAGKKFANKIWNAARFTLLNSNAAEDYPQKISESDLINEHDKKIAESLERIKRIINEHIENFEFGQALHSLYDFFWHEFCDEYIEKSKKQLNNKVLGYVLTTSLKLLHPFMPFITEEIWTHIPGAEKPLIIEQWPS